MPTYRVFLVEDNEIIRDSMRDLLSEIEGVEVVGWADCEQLAASELIEPKLTWQLAIVDLFLREGSGFGVLTRCARAMRLRNDRTCVVASNYVNEDVRAQAAAMGAVRVFDKSREVAALYAFVESEATKYHQRAQRPTAFSATK